MKNPHAVALGRKGGKAGKGVKRPSPAYRLAALERWRKVKACLKPIGEGTGFKAERADCTVVATAHILGIHYTWAHALLESYGRKRGCRFKFRIVAERCGLELRPELSCRTLRSILPHLQKGRFVVKVRHHVFPVIDGFRYENLPGYLTPMGARVKMVYQYLPK